MMKKRYPSILLTAIFLIVWVSLPLQSFAQAPQGTPTITPSLPLTAGGQATPMPTSAQAPLPSSDPLDILTFAELGLKNTLLEGPYDSLTARFSLPVNWQPLSGAMLHLDLVTAYNTVTGSNGLASEVAGGTIDITLNDVLVTSLVLNWIGEKHIDIPVPTAALALPRGQERHRLALFLDAAIDCDIEFHHTTVMVSDQSYLYLPHTLVSPATDLSRLPWPFFTSNSVITNTALLVVPDDPSEQELQAALVASAAFGRMSNGELLLNLAPVGELTDELRASSNLIFVGKPGAFSLLNDAALPLPIVNSSFDSPIVQVDDGVLQEAFSPWNSGNMLLLVSGNSDAGVIKAAQALSTGEVRLSASPDLVVVADVRESIPEAEAAPNDRTFADLGYDTLTLSGVGAQSAEYRFYIPPGFSPGGDATLNLVSSHSTLFDYTGSTMMVALNGTTVGSLAFNDENAGQTEETFDLPANLFRPGGNRLVITVNLVPQNFCAFFSAGADQTSALWVTIHNHSLLHLPLMPAGEMMERLSDLRFYPYPFISSPTLATTGFLLAQSDANGWDMAQKIAFDLGRRSYGEIFELAAAYSLPETPVPAEFMDQRHLLLIGRASMLPVIAEINDDLPASFEPGSDVALERGFQIIYRMPEGTSLGYLQLLVTPWNAQRQMLAVLGSTDEGVRWAGMALADSSQWGRLSGNFVVLNGWQFFSTDTRVGMGTTGNLSATAAPQTIPGAITTQVVTPVVVAPPPQVTSMNWIPAAVVVISIMMLVIIVIAMVQSIRRRE